MASGLVIAREDYAIGSVDRGEVLRYLGYRGQSVSPELDERLDALIARAIEVASPRGALRSFRVASRTDDEVTLAGTTLTLRGRDIAGHLADAVEVVVFAVTLGLGTDRELRLLSATDSLAQVVVDSASSTLVERAADAANARAVAYAASLGMHASWRFSPGYGDMPLDSQPDFLAATDATRRLGITLTDSNLMIPTKSVTAVVGIHPTPQPDSQGSCPICSFREFCSLRKSGRTCHG